MWSLPTIPFRRRPKTVAALAVDVDEERIVAEIVAILRRAGYPVDLQPGRKWHERASVDYGSGPCLTSVTSAFDHLMRRRERERAAA